MRKYLIVFVFFDLAGCNGCGLFEFISNILVKKNKVYASTIKNSFEDEIVYKKTCIAECANALNDYLNFVGEIMIMQDVEFDVGNKFEEWIFDDSSNSSFSSSENSFDSSQKCSTNSVGDSSKQSNNEPREPSCRGLLVLAVNELSENGGKRFLRQKVEYLDSLFEEHSLKCEENRSNNHFLVAKRIYDAKNIFDNKLKELKFRSLNNFKSK